MSAAELRKAAETLRERAENASTGDGPTLSREWMHDLTYMSRRYEVTAKDEGSIIASNLDRWTAEFIATMHPGVGLALADWLDTAGADLWAYGPLCECGSGCNDCDDSLWEPHVRRALAVARLINGGAE